MLLYFQINGHFRSGTKVKKAAAMESVLIINGATRENGNTDVIVSKLAEGIGIAGLNVRCASYLGKASDANQIYCSLVFPIDADKPIYLVIEKSTYAARAQALGSSCQI